MKLTSEPAIYDAFYHATFSVTCFATYDVVCSDAYPTAYEDVYHATDKEHGA